jgi:hypothetical protein
MNITLNIPNTSTKITIEGTQAELQSIVTMLLQISQPISLSLPTVTSKEAPASSIASAIEGEVYNARLFIASLYVYKSNLNSAHGRTRYAAEMLVDGKPHSISQITKTSKSSYASIINMIKFLSSAGAVITVDDRSPNPVNHTYTLVSVPNKKYRPRKRSYSPKAINPLAKTPADVNASTILSGKKA